MNIKSKIFAKIHPSRAKRRHHRKLVKPESLQTVNMRKDYFFDCSKTDPVIIDCGANKGDSIQIFLDSHPYAQVEAFEPDPNLFGDLVERFRNKNHVILHCAAVSNKTGETKFFCDGKDTGSCLNSRIAGDPIVVSTVRLKDVILRHKRIDFLKVDIEGLETSVIVDCDEDLKIVERIFIEYHSFADKRQELSKILAVLERLNFRYQIDEEWNRRANRWKYEDNGNNMDCQVKIYALGERLWQAGR